MDFSQDNTSFPSEQNHPLQHAIDSLVAKLRAKVPVDDETFFRTIDQLQSQAVTTPRHFTIPRHHKVSWTGDVSDGEFDHRRILNVEWGDFTELFPEFNRRVPLVVRRSSECYHVIDVLKSRPDFAKLINQIDFVGYHLDEPTVGKKRLEAEIVQLCGVVDTVTIDIHINDICVYEPKPGQTEKVWRSATLEEVRPKYQFYQLCRGKKGEKRVKQLRYRFVGSELKWKLPLVKAFEEELRLNQRKGACPVEKLPPAGILDPYLGRQPMESSMVPLFYHRKEEVEDRGPTPVTRPKPKQKPKQKGKQKQKQKQKARQETPEGGVDGGEEGEGEGQEEGEWEGEWEWEGEGEGEEEGEEGN